MAGFVVPRSVGRFVFICTIRRGRGSLRHSHWSSSAASTGHTTMARLDVSKRSALVDDKLGVVVRGLAADQDITVTAWLEDRGRVYASCAAFTADRDGQVDLATAASHRGTYTGISDMGLFWSMKPTPDMKKGVRLLKFDVTTPLLTKLSVYPGHLDIPDPRTATTTPIATAEVARWYMDTHVERIPVNQDGLVGTLFVPRGVGRVPGIVDVFGSVGGVIEFRAALLASRGFVTFALGYIFYDQAHAFESNLEYYEKAIDFVRNHPQVAGTGVGMVGVSKGSEVCLLTSIVSPHVKAVVSIGGNAWVTGCIHSHKAKGMHFPPAGIDCVISKKTGKYTFTFIDESYGRVETEEGMLYSMQPDKIAPESFIPVERTHAKLLMVSGDDDPWVPPHTAYLVSERLRRAGRPDVCQILRYRRAGHLIEPPYLPYCRAAYIPNEECCFIWGGYPEEHAHAEEDLWHKMLLFFRETLSLPDTASKL